MQLLHDVVPRHAEGTDVAPHATGALLLAKCLLHHATSRTLNGMRDHARVDRARNNRLDPTNLSLHVEGVHVALEAVVRQRMGHAPLLVPSHVRETLVTDRETAMPTDGVQGMLTQRCLLNILGATEGDGIPRRQLEDSAPLPIVSGQFGSVGQTRETLLWRCSAILQPEVLEVEVVLGDSVALCTS